MSDDTCRQKFTGTFSWPDVITNANVQTSNYTTVYDYQLEVWVTTYSHDLVRKTSIIYPFHFQVVRTAQLTIIYPVHPEPTIEPTLEPTLEPTVEPTPEPTFEPSRQPTFEPTKERNFFLFFNFFFENPEIFCNQKD